MSDWLASMGLETWRQRFRATDASVSELTEYCRDTGQTIIGDFLSTATAAVPFGPYGDPFTWDREEVNVGIRPGSSPPSTLVVTRANGEEVGYIHATHHVEVEAIIATGLGLSFVLELGELRVERS